MRKRILSLFLVSVLGLAAAFGCTQRGQQGGGGETTDKFKGKEVTIYIRMMEEQDKWFRDNIVAKFEQQYGAKVNVRTFEKDVDLENILELDKDKKTIALVKVPHTELGPLVKKDLVMTLEDAAGDRYQNDIQEYTEDSMQMAAVEGKVYYIPRKLETNTLLYLKSKVDEAAQNWEKFRNEIDGAFKKANGVGLPTDYALEGDPNKWDWYDLAVVGYYWANTPYNGVKEPRIAHRAKRYEGTAVELVTKVYQMGGKPEDLLDMSSQPVVDTYEWEKFYKDNNIYNPTMWQEEWSGGGIWNAMAQGKVYLAFMHQIDAFFVHGGSTPQMTGYLADPNDMGVAVMPQGASLELEDGKPARTGIHGSQLAGWWWGIPKSTPDPELSYELARFITNSENHTAESATFGMMPVRKDIYENLGNAFKEQWMQDVFNTASAQQEAGIQPLPQVAQWPQVQYIYIDAWYDIVVNEKYDDVGKALRDVYTPRAADTLKE